jgi:hypothetical protein
MAANAYVTGVGTICLPKVGSRIEWKLINLVKLGKKALLGQVFIYFISISHCLLLVKNRLKDVR